MTGIFMNGHLANSNTVISYFRRETVVFLGSPLKGLVNSPCCALAHHAAEKNNGGVNLP